MIKYTGLVKCPSCQHEGYAIVTEGPAVSETECEVCNTAMVRHDSDGEIEWRDKNG